MSCASSDSSPALRARAFCCNTSSATAAHAEVIARLTASGCARANGHSQSSGLLLPSSEKERLPHAVTAAHSVQDAGEALPVMREKVLPGHFVHRLMSLPAEVLYVPAGHSRHLLSLL